MKKNIRKNNEKKNIEKNTRKTIGFFQSFFNLFSIFFSILPDDRGKKGTEIQFRADFSLICFGEKNIENF